VIASVPAIFFAFDGFYSTAGLFEDMNDPKKFSKALSIGIVIIAFVYVLISLGVMVSSDDGTVIGFVSNFDKTMPGKIVGFIIMFAIFLSVLSILNGYAIYSGEFLFSLIKNNEFIFSKYIQKKINLFDSKKLSLFIYGIFFVIFVLCCTIGVFYFKDVYQGAYYDDQTCGIYQLCDLLSN
jgi:amino acid transporter